MPDSDEFEAIPYRFAVDFNVAWGNEKLGAKSIDFAGFSEEVYHDERNKLSNNPDSSTSRICVHADARTRPKGLS